MSMVSSVQKKLLNYVDEHFLSYYEAWKRSSIALARSPISSKKRMAQEAIISQFLQYGIKPLLLGVDHPLLLLPLTDANYPLAPFRQILGLPIALTTMGSLAHEYEQKEQFGAYIKLIILLIEELANHAIDRN